MKPFQRMIRVDQLEAVSPAESFRDAREPPLSTGNVVRLNSGSPRLMVVNIDGSAITVAWLDEDGGVHEREFRRECLHRAAVL